jgi:NAD+ synthase (glutamine-hydrolysing)
MDELMKQSPDFMINIAASPFDYDQAQERLNVLKWNVNKYKLPLVYVNHVGSQTELIFDGGSLFLNEKAEIVHQLPFFSEQTSTIDTEEKTSSLADTSQPKIALIHDALVLGIKDYFTKSGFSKAVLGLSGGIDSAVVAALAAQALGPENVLAVMLPSQYSSDHSIKDAKDLINNIGLKEQLLPIKNIYSSFEKELAELFAEKNADLTEENMQARIRGVLLMAVSNKFGNILLNTSNKSEAAVGYGTLYGDMCGGLSVIGDVYKTQVYELAKYINREKELIPLNTIEKAPSAELRPGQKDSDSLPAYELLDEVLYNYIELAKGKSELLKLGFESTLIERVTGLVNRNEYKRYQTPPILRISPKAFGMGRRMPIVAKY